MLCCYYCILETETLVEVYGKGEISGEWRNMCGPHFGKMREKCTRIKFFEKKPRPCPVCGQEIKYDE